MEALNSKTYHAAVYLRLSREDGDVAEGSRALSNSISNQKELVMDYLRSHAEENRLIDTKGKNKISGKSQK